MKVKIRKKGKTTEKFIKNLQDLHKESVTVGHFESQGEHYSGATYPDLMEGYASGSIGDYIVRNPLAVFSESLIKRSGAGEFNLIVKRWGEHVLESPAINKLLDDLGENLAKEYQDMFGVVGAGMPADSTGTPLYEEGDLKENVAHKNSKSKTVKVV